MSSSQFVEGQKIVMLESCSGLAKGQLAILKYNSIERRLMADNKCWCQRYWGEQANQDSSSNNNQVKNKIMSLIEKVKLALKGEPEKSFNKAGITDSNDMLTSEGKDVLLNWLLMKHGTEFKTDVVDPILAEEKAK